MNGRFVRPASQSSARSVAGDVEDRFVAILGVVLAQPAVAVGGPVLKIGAGVAWEGVLAEVAAQVEQVVLQLQRELGLRQGADIRLYVCAVEKARDQGSVIRSEQAPRWMAVAQAIERLEIHGDGLNGVVRVKLMAIRFENIA